MSGDVDNCPLSWGYLDNLILLKAVSYNYGYQVEMIPFFELGGLQCRSNSIVKFIKTNNGGSYPTAIFYFDF